MKLSKKVFIYTAGTTFLVGILIISYFMFMLPGLYANHKSQKFVDSIETLQRNMMQGKGCDFNSLGNETLISLGASIPKQGYEIPVCNAYFSGIVVIEVQEIKDTFDEVRDIVLSMEDKDSEFDADAFAKIDWTVFQKLGANNGTKDMIAFKNFEGRNFFVPDDNPLTDQRMSNDGIMTISSQVSDNTNSYSTYFSYSTDKNNIYITVGSVMTPKLNELVPIVWGSVPMIFGLLILMVLVTAQWFSKKLATPVETLANQARNRHEVDGVVFKQSNRGDEFETLENALNTMHNDLKTMLADLDRQNQELKLLQNKQEVFLMNASHQLKTPIASASLLLQGMMDKVGKYADSETYLPKVAQEIRRMQTIIESMMVIFQEKYNEISLQKVDLKSVMESMIQMQEPALLSKNITVENRMTAMEIETDPELMVSMIENILSNAVKYTDTHKKILIENTQTQLKVTNEGARINPDLIENIKQAFVRSNDTDEHGTGLGLYLVDTFANMLGYTWDIENTDKGVCVTLDLRGETL